MVLGWDIHLLQEFFISRRFIGSRLRLSLELVETGLMERSLHSGGVNDAVHSLGMRNLLSTVEADGGIEGGRHLRRLKMLGPDLLVYVRRHIWVCLLVRYKVREILMLLSSRRWLEMSWIQIALVSLAWLAWLDTAVDLVLDEIRQVIVLVINVTGMDWLGLFLLGIERLVVLFLFFPGYRASARVKFYYRVH